ncbi:S8 family serine peptidase [Streptosporangium soli]|nr:S8 family serine peptidase [Streptosporangium sp. KLBMP 9127]
MLRPRARWGALVVLVMAMLAAVVAPAAAEPLPDGRWVLQALNVEQAWRTTKGNGVTVAVIDSGIDDEVPELRGRVVQGPDMRTPAVETQGEQGAPDEPGKHGTAMASLIAGSGADGGIRGVAPEARVLSLPLLADEPIEGQRSERDEDRGTGRNNPLSRAVRYAANHGADVISMSLGAYGAHPAEREAIAYALRRGVVMVAAVGNDGEDAVTRKSGTSFWSFPAGYSGVIGVAAVDEEALPAPFSSDNLSVLVSAPGVNVPVALPGGRRGIAAGSSPAAALVSGVAALIKAEHPELSPAQVARALTTTARSKSAGYDDKVGFGMVDAGEALAKAARLASDDRTVPVPGDRHFGQGPVPAPPTPPGPDPLRMWAYTGAVLVGLVVFGGSVMILTRRAEQRRGR